jgi:arginyl-tRNA synthetase
MKEFKKAINESYLDLNPSLIAIMLIKLSKVFNDFIMLAL